MITQDRLKEVLDYNQETGEFTWKQRLSRRVSVGDIAGTPNHAGYITIQVDRKIYRAHRLAYLFVYNNNPKCIDHIDGDKKNNKILNLRACQQIENTRNSKKKSNNTSGVKCVQWNKRKRKWMARIDISGKPAYVGYFPDLIGAELAVRKMRNELHGEYANHG